MDDATQRTLIITIVAGVIIIGTSIIILFCLCRRHCRCTSTCLCFGEARNHEDYENLNKSEKSSKSYGQDICSICLEDMKKDEDLYRAPCRHKFHRECLDSWLAKNNRCPMCNDKVRATPVNEPLAQNLQFPGEAPFVDISINTGRAANPSVLNSDPKV